ncbi:DUF1045 domain-containing protein [Dyella sp. 2HG41-7]|uniref:DUF1045 domain-containing protein n=1 Tax=Dyella sp. 2HG41-7 TaxID=2883239 RepID=UPI001F1E66BA|nr:DUF1045 domain-containing protein [Dyella sp. 2HG41-7]
MRYAVYFCPAEGSALDVLGREWLSIEQLPAIEVERLRALTINVRRYGWHATLCAPFALTESARYDDLRREVVDIAQRSRTIEVPLQLDKLAGFLALRPSVEEQPIKALAERCVRQLNALRAPNTEAAWRRRAPHLDGVELALFRQFGYPYVLDRFRFHMTVAAPADDGQERSIREWFAPFLAKGLAARIEALTLCYEKAPDRPFEVIERIPLGTGTAT